MTEAAPRPISAIAFLQRFTVAEEVAIRAFAIGSNPAAPAVAVFLGRILDPRLLEVNLDHPDTIAGLSLLQSVDLLTAARVTAIRA